LAEIIPLKAWHYNEDLAGAIQTLTSPLFDVITPGNSDHLYNNPLNSIHLSASRGDNPADKAASTLERWKKEGILQLDEEPSIYVYYQYFTLPGEEKKYCRKGFICNIRVYDWPENVILRHENTIPSSVTNRIEHLAKTELNVSPTHGLYSDPSFELERFMDESMVNPVYDTLDYQGVRDVLSRISDTEVIKKFVAKIKDLKIILADGHHRYESSLQLKKTKQSQPDYDRYSGYNYHLMYLTNGEAEDIKILPIHRLLVDLSDFDENKFITELEKYFHIQMFDRNIYRLAKSFQGQKGMFGIVLPSYYLLIKLKSNLHTQCIWKFPEEIKALDLTALHYFIIEKIAGIPGKAQRASEQIIFEKSLEICRSKVENGEANVAILTNPVTMEEIKEVCYSGYTLPQKSTYFYPKVITGFLFSSIKENEFSPYHSGL
jgi:uncharacterized protein (DUF1015 family)